MNLRISRAVLAPHQVYVYFPCRLCNASRSHHLSPRFLHVETAEGGGNSPDAPTVAPKPNSNDDSSNKVQDAVIASSQATTLQQMLQRQFAEKRRRNMGTSDLRQAIAAEVKDRKKKPNRRTAQSRRKEKSSKKSKSTEPALSDKTATSSNTAISTLQETIDAMSKVSSAHRPIVTENHDPPREDPSVKLHADVQKLKRALETNDKAKRTSRIKLSKLQAPKGQTTVSAGKVILKSDTLPKGMVRRLVSKDAGGTSDNVLTGMRSVKNAHVRAVRSPHPEGKTSKGLDATLLRMPRRTGSGKNAVIEVVNAHALEISAVEVDQPPVPNLSYGLDRVLFNPGVYHLQDPRSRVYNFDPYLEKIMPVTEFDFSALKAYVTSSGDDALKRIARQNGKRYVGSSSSMTSVLAHFHFLLSQWREIGISMLSKTFPKTASKTFTKIQKAPTAVFLRWRDGTYAIDADKQFANANILMMLGKSMEKLLTLEKGDFERYRRSSEDAVPVEERNTPESYHYSTMGDFLMRSQLDAHDARLPGTGMFDLKTRAVVSVRMANQQVERGMGYEIKSRLGEFESYEREYYDMLRSAMLKYSLQVRMGRMDGIFVAYHNTQRIFGFQYISLAEMDAAMHGQWDTALGDQQFKLSLDLFNKVLDRATKKYPEQSLRIHFETREAQTPFMYVFAEPVTEEQIQEIQSENDAAIAEYERKMLGLQEDIETAPCSDEDGKWADMQANVEEEMDKDEVSLSSAETDKVETSEVAGQELPDTDDLEAMDKGPLWVSARAGNVQDEPVAVAVDENNLDNDEESEPDDMDESDGEALLAEQPENQEHPKELAEHDVSANVKTGEAAAASMDSLGGDAATGEVLSNDTAGEGFPKDHHRVGEVSFSSDMDAAETEEASERDPENGLQSNQQDSETGSFNIEEQSPASMVEDIGPAADAPSENSAAKAAGATSHSEEVLAMTLTIRNKINDRYVHRPEHLSSNDQWSVEYAMAEVGDKSKAWNLYQASQARRAKALDQEDEDDESRNVDYFIQRLRALSVKGQRWREKQDELDRTKPRFILGQSSAKGDLYGMEDPKSKI